MSKISEPWQPEKFLKGEQNTFPYQHETAVFYRAEPISSFFGDNSILKKRFIEASNGFYTKGGETGDADAHTAKSHGVFGGFLETARFYARGDKPDPVLRIQAPTSDLVTIYVPPEERSKRGEHPDPETRSVNNLEGLRQLFSSPEDMRRLSKESLEDREGFGGYEYIMFMIPHEVPVNSEQNWVTGVWDFSFYNEPYWESLSEYVESIKARHPKAVPKGISPDESKEKIKRELEDIEKLHSLLQKLNEDLRFSREVLKADNASELSEKHRNYLKGRIEAYHNTLNTIYELISSEFDIEIVNKGVNIESLVQVNTSSLSNVKEQINSIEEEIKEIDSEERMHAKEILKSGGSPEKYKAEAEYETKVEERLSEEISSLPTFSGLEDKL